MSRKVVNIVDHLPCIGLANTAVWREDASKIGVCLQGGDAAEEAESDDAQARDFQLSAVTPAESIGADRRGRVSGAVGWSNLLFLEVPASPCE